jgi:flavodoxin
MKILVLYYSLDGNTKFIADTISEEINCDILRLNPKKDVPKKGFLKFVWGGKQVVLNQKPELESLNKDFKEYDLIIMGSPVWAGSYAPAFNTFFSEVNIINKKIALFCCYAGSEGKIFNAFKSQLGENEVIGEIGFKDPIKNNRQQNIENVKQWMHKCIDSFKN